MSEREYMRLIGERIREARRLKRLNQTEVARHLGLHQAAFSRIETGTQMITPFELYKLKELGIEISLDLYNHS